VEIGRHLTVVASQTEADIICSLLRANGIRCGERALGVTPLVGGMGGSHEILVSEDQLGAARELLATTPPTE
jgi:hypothetical protein